MPGLAAETETTELETVDLLDVEILAAGGPYFGQGSPPEGDEFTEDEIAAIAEANQELEGEIRPFLKIGHGKEQKLLRASGLADDELPAAGWWTNFRAVGGKIRADAMRVPKKLAELIEAGAFRTRSVELSRVTSQRGDKKKYPAVITAVSLLGARAPAVHSLADIIALYAGLPEVEATRRVIALLAEDDAGEPELPETRYVSLAAGEIVWDPADGCSGLSEKVRKALNPGPEDYRYWVMDVARDGSRAIVGSNGATYVVPIELDAGTGDVRVSPASDWTLAESAWVEAAAEYARALADAPMGVAEDERDTSGRMPTITTETKFDEAQIDALASALSIVETDPAKRREAVTARLSEGLAGETDTPPEGDPPPAPDVAPVVPVAPVEPVSALAAAEMETLRANADLGKRVFEERRTEKREAAIDRALSEGRMDPARREFWTKAFDEDAERAALLLAEMPVNEEFKKVYGADNTGVESGDVESAMFEQWGAMSGVPSGAAA